MPHPASVRPPILWIFLALACALAGWLAGRASGLTEGET
jgi:hypothetical protein